MRGAAGHMGPRRAGRSRRAPLRLAPGRVIVAAHARGLFACQVAAVAGAVGGVLAIGVRGWGAWLPALAVFLGTLGWGRRFAPPGLLEDRSILKAVALGAGSYGGLGVVALGLTLRGLRPDLLDVTWLQALALAALAGVATVPVATMLGLVGLDAARTAP